MSECAPLRSGKGDVNLSDAAGRLTDAAIVCAGCLSRIDRARVEMKYFLFVHAVRGRYRTCACGIDQLGPLRLALKVRTAVRCRCPWQLALLTSRPVGS